MHFCEERVHDWGGMGSKELWAFWSLNGIVTMPWNTNDEAEVRRIREQTCGCAGSRKSRWDKYSNGSIAGNTYPMILALPVPMNRRPGGILDNCTVLVLEEEPS